jgi:hypothetical protein
MWPVRQHCLGEGFTDIKVNCFTKKIISRRKYKVSIKQAVRETGKGPGVKL